MEMFYKGELKEDIDERIKQQGLPKGKSIGALRRELRVALDNSQPEVQEVVKAEVAVRKQALKAKASEAPKTSPIDSPLTPSELQRYASSFRIDT